MSRTGQGQGDAVDTRRVARLALGNWRWIAASTLVAAGAAFGLGLLTPETFQATALVAISKPGVAPGGEGLVQLALSDAVLRVVLESDEVEGRVGAPVSVDQLRDQLSAHVSDPFLVLTASGADARIAASTVNSWARALVERLIGDYRVSQSATFTWDVLAEQARDGWRSAELAWLDSETRFELEGLQARRQELLNLRGRNAQLALILAEVVEEAEAIRIALSGERPEQPAETRLEAAVIVLESRVAGARDLAERGVEASDDDQAEASTAEAATRLSGERSVGELIDVLDGIVAVSQYEKELVGEVDARLERELRGLRRQMREVELEDARLRLERDVAGDALRLVESFAQEQELRVYEDLEVAKVVSEASPPTAPARPRSSRDVPLAGAVGFFLGLGWIFVRDWWKAGAS